MVRGLVVRWLQVVNLNREVRDTVRPAVYTAEPGGSLHNYSHGDCALGTGPANAQVRLTTASGEKQGENTHGHSRMRRTGNFIRGVSDTHLTTKAIARPVIAIGASP